MSCNRDHMKAFTFVQVRRYPYLPADFFDRLRDWFVANSFELSAFNQNSAYYTRGGGMGDGSMSGRRTGLHLNFVPKFTFDVKSDPTGYVLSFCYYARIRKIGIASAIITQGLTAVIGAATMAGHVATERGFVESVWHAVDSIVQGPYEIILLQGPEAVDNYQQSNVTTTIITPPPTVIAYSPQPQISQNSSFYQMRTSSSSGAQSPYNNNNMVPNYPPISSSQTQPPMMTNSPYPGYGSANRKDISSDRLQYSGGMNVGNVSGSTVGKSQSLYGSNSQQMGTNTSSTSGYGGGVNSTSGYGSVNSMSGYGGVNASRNQSLYGSNSQQMGANTSSTSGYGGGVNSSSMGGTQNPFAASTDSLYGATSQTRSDAPSSPSLPSVSRTYNIASSSPAPHPYAHSGGGSQAQTQAQTQAQSQVTQSQIQGQSKTATLYPTPLDSTKVSGSSSAITDQSSNVTIAQQQQQQQGTQSPSSAPSTTPRPYAASQGRTTAQGVSLDKDATQQNQIPKIPSMAKGGLGYGYSFAHLSQQKKEQQ